jgi:c-di-GMP-binding flagellar brake protein YcgR
MAFMEEGINPERRKHPRFKIDLPVKYNSRSKLFSKFGRAVNASEGGLLVRLPEEMAVGQRLALRLFYHSLSELNIIAPSVEVVWTGIHLKNDFTWDYRTGVRFVDIPPKDMIKFRKYLMSFAQKPSYSS